MYISRVHAMLGTIAMLLFAGVDAQRLPNSVSTTAHSPIATYNYDGPLASSPNGIEQLLDPTPVVQPQSKPNYISTDLWTTFSDAGAASETVHHTNPDNTDVAATEKSIVHASASRTPTINSVEDAVATTENVINTAEGNEPLAEPHTQTEQGAWALEHSTSDDVPDEQPPLPSPQQQHTDRPTVPTIADTTHTLFANPQQREAKTIVDSATLLDDNDGFETLDDSTSPFAAELTFNKRQRAKTFEADEYDEPTSTALHSRRGFTDATAADTAGTDDETDDYVQHRSSFARPSEAPSNVPTGTTESPTSNALTTSSSVYMSTAPSQIASTTHIDQNVRTLQQSTSTTTTTTTTTTTSAPAVEEPSNVGVDEILRRYVYESHVRTPMALLVDATNNVLRKTRVLFKAALKPLPNFDVILMTFNMSGIGVTYKFNNTFTLFAGLNSLQDSRDGPGATFFGLVRVTKMIPYDSAIFVCTDRAPVDPTVGKHAAMTLLKKRIRVFLIWFGQPAPAGHTEGGMLGELALQSGGDIVHVTKVELGQINHINDVLADDEIHPDEALSSANLVKRLRPVRDNSNASARGG